MKGIWTVIGLAMILGFFFWLIEYKNIIPTEVSLAGAGTAKFANNTNSGINNSSPAIVDASNKNQKLVNNDELLTTIDNKPYKENFTKSKKGLFVVTQDWRRGWESYLTIYENFVQLPTNKGYRILNSLNKNNIFDSKNDMFAEVAGYIRTNEGVFYITKYSYNNRNKDGYPKFIDVIK